MPALRRERNEKQHADRRKLNAPIEALYQRARTSPNGVAFIVDDDKWKYGWLAAQAERVARGLAGRGIRKGNRIAPHMPNRPEFVVAVYACFHIGAVAVPLNNRLEAADLKPLLERLRPALYIGDANLYSKIDAIDGSMFTHDCSGKVLSDDEIVDVHMRTYELSDKISVRPCFENHNNMWSEQSGGLRRSLRKYAREGVPLAYMIDSRAPL